MGIADFSETHTHTFRNRQHQRLLLTKNLLCCAYGRVYSRVRCNQAGIMKQQTQTSKCGKESQQQINFFFCHRELSLPCPIYHGAVSAIAD